MSYIILITRKDIPKIDKLAWVLLDKLVLREKKKKPNQDFITLIEKLTSKYQCISKLSDDDLDNGVWSDGPLINNAGHDITTLSLVNNKVDEVLPFIISMANKNGFVVFDKQTSIIHRVDDKKMRWVWLISLVLSIVAFLFLIPNSVYNLSPLIFSVLGAALSMLFLIQIFYNFRNIQDYHDKVEHGNDTKFKILAVSSIPLTFILYMTFWMNFAFDKSNEIEEYGMKTKGTIISAHVTNIRRKTGSGKVFYAKVKFVTENRKTIISEEQITEEQYKNISIGQEIEVSYSKKDPNIVELNIEEKKDLANLKISQLIDLLNIPKDSVGLKLKTLNPRLKQVDENNWKDEHNDVIRIDNSKMVSAIIRGDLMSKFYLELKQLGFKRVEVESDQELFESEDYKIILNKRIDGLWVHTVAIVARK